MSNITHASLSADAPLVLAPTMGHDAERRWAVWKARGVAHDAAVRGRVLRVGILAAVVVAASVGYVVSFP